MSYSYQHRYHAGNFADIHKQLILLAIFQSLHQKPTPFCALDLFAGEGCYDLSSNEAQKNQEYLTGFELLQDLAKQPLGAELLKIIEDTQDLGGKNTYPGSSAIIQSQLRSQDRGIFIENHPQAYNLLEQYFKADKNIKCYKEDAFLAINALLPFPEKRGLIFIDPSYEVKTEYKAIATAVEKAYKKFATGIYAIWYPLLVDKNHHQDLLININKLATDKIFTHQWTPLKGKIDTGMYGSGVIVINPPWELNQKLSFLNNVFTRNP
jgi:23S rRNA (adenine2030-N6)-methyltransferase